MKTSGIEKQALEYNNWTEYTRILIMYGDHLHLQCLGTGKYALSYIVRDENENIKDTVTIYIVINKTLHGSLLSLLRRQNVYTYGS
jgi:hypothetical protein